MEVDKQLLGYLVNGGFSAALLFLLWKVGTALIAAIKDLATTVKEHGQRLDDHAINENEHHTLVREEMANLRGHLGIPTPVHGVPISVGRQPSSPVRTTVGRAKSEPGR